MMSTVLAVGDKAHVLNLPRLESRSYYRKAPRLIVGAFSLPPGLLWGRQELQKSWHAYEQMIAALEWTKAPSVAMVLDAGRPTSPSQTRRLFRLSRGLLGDIVVDARNSLGMDVTAFGIIVNCTDSGVPEGQRIRTAVESSLHELASTKAEPGPTVPLTVEAWHLHDHTLTEIFQQTDL